MNGIVIINKPKNCTSHDVVYKVKKIFGQKVGHTGTLDPNATGVLPVLVGKGTLISKYLINHNKIYEVTLKLGIKTATADGEGNIVEEKNVSDESLQELKIKEVLENFKGKQMQTPPIYSAIKVHGKKLYEYARSGKKVEIEPREIEIYDIKLNNVDIGKKEIKFSVYCSKGTYIRSLCEDIASNLSTVGFMKELNRAKVGDFSIKDSITIEELENNINNKEFIESHLINIEDLFKNNGIVNLNNSKLQLFLNGVKLSFNLNDGVYKVYNNDVFIGLGVVQSNLLKRDVVL